MYPLIGFIIGGLYGIFGVTALLTVLLGGSLDQGAFIIFVTGPCGAIAGACAAYNLQKKNWPAFGFWFGLIAGMVPGATLMLVLGNLLHLPILVFAAALLGWVIPKMVSTTNTNDQTHKKVTVVITLITLALIAVYFWFTIPNKTPSGFFKTNLTSYEHLFKLPYQLYPPGTRVTTPGEVLKISETKSVFFKQKENGSYTIVYNGQESQEYPEISEIIKIDDSYSFVVGYGSKTVLSCGLECKEKIVPEKQIVYFHGKPSKAYKIITNVQDINGELVFIVSKGKYQYVVYKTKELGPFDGSISLRSVEGKLGIKISSPSSNLFFLEK